MGDPELKTSSLWADKFLMEAATPAMPTAPAQLGPGPQCAYASSPGHTLSLVDLLGTCSHVREHSFCTGYVAGAGGCCRWSLLEETWTGKWANQPWFRRQNTTCGHT